jgi:hypothetical protein
MKHHPLMTVIDELPISERRSVTRLLPVKDKPILEIEEQEVLVMRVLLPGQFLEGP